MRRVLWFILLGLLGLTQINCGPKASPASPSGASGNAYSFITNIGQDGSPYNPYEFYDISGVAVSGDKLFVSDTDYWNIEVYDLAGNYLTYFWPYYTFGDVPEPYALAADAYGHLYIADPYYDYVSVLNVSSILLPASPGQAVTATAYYSVACEPTGVAVDQNAVIYVADACAGAVYSIIQTGINSGSGNGTSSGSASINGGYLDNPYGIAVAPDGSKIYVADSSDNVVQVYDGDFNWLSAIGDATGAASTATGKFDYPEGLALDNSGNLLAVDADNARIQKFSPSGSYLTSFGNTATNVSNGQLTSPWQIATDAQNRAYVTDTNYETLFIYGNN